MDFVTHVIAILFLAVLAASWIGVQLLARKVGTKNHFDTKTNCCGYCAEEDKEGCSLHSNQGYAGTKS